MSDDVPIPKQTDTVTFDAGKLSEETLRILYGGPPPQPPPSTRVAWHQPAPDGDRFAQGCFDSSIGVPLTCNMFGVSRPGVLIAAEVSEDGTSAWLTADLPHAVAHVLADDLAKEQ